MQWSDVATRLFDRYGPAAVLLDQDLRIRRVNRAAEASFGWSQTTMVGRPLVDVVELRNPSEGGSCVDGFRSASPSDVVHCELRLTTTTGHVVDRRAEVRVVEGRERTYLLELATGTPRATQPPPLGWSLHPERPRPDVLRFDIDTRPEHFGTIHQADESMVAGRGWVGRRCYETLFQRERPCERCPGRSTGPEGTSASEVLYDGAHYHAVRSRRVGPALARITHRHLDDELVRGLVGARLEALADAAELSEREREVLELVALGRTLDDMAQVLDITPRTVRFHQANLLAKLGADSRLDLLRLLL